MITIITEDDRTYPIDVDSTIEVENLKALLEADTCIPASSQQLVYNGTPLCDDKKTLDSYGVGANDLILLRDERQRQRPPMPQNEEQASEILRNQILSNPTTMAQLRANRPELAEAAQTNPSRFLEMVKAIQATAPPTRSGDEFDIDAQRRIEEAIRQERVMENLEHAMEYSPESFGRVTMLYVDCKVNGTEVKAFVDSGAQATIMSPECAERCGIMRLLDTRFAGIARGVGTAKILGRVHSAQIQLGEGLFLPCSFTIMEGKGVEMLFGLDMLKRYQANMDLSQNALVIQGNKIKFLDEHELPQEAKMEYQVDEQGKPVPKPPPAAAVAANANAISSSSATPSFPGTGESVGSRQPPESHGMSFSHPTPAAPAPRWPESAIQSLVDLGATRTQAIRFLDASNGNLEIAASLLFQQ